MYRFLLTMLFVCLPLCAAVALRAEEPLQNPLDADRAVGYLKQICALGPRPSGSKAMQRQQSLLRNHFEAHGATVEMQRFKAKNPLGGPRVPMANLIARWHPDRKDRILFCAHYDTLPLPLSDPNPYARRWGRFIGANDGASGVAVWMELAHLLKEYDGPWGVDVVLFDGEELVYNIKRDPFFWGSNWFAHQYKKSGGGGVRYRWGILLDMVGDRDQTLYWERICHSWPDTRPLNERVWQTAERLGQKQFVPMAKVSVQDDHLPLRNQARIPTIDIIDFDYPAWHTEADTPRQCSGESLASVGWVVWEWLLTEPGPDESVPERP